MYRDNILPFRGAAGLDAVLLIAVTVTAVIVGKPLSYLNCATLPSSGGDAAAFVESIGSNMSNLNYYIWAGASSPICFEMKSIWGLTIALCILFAFSSICMGCLWKTQKDSKAAGTAKAAEDAEAAKGAEAAEAAEAAEGNTPF
jgi:hypothetical protein